MYNEHSLVGKRSFPKTNYNDGAPSNRRRDMKGSQLKRDSSSLAGGVPTVGEETDGDFSNYPEIPDQSVKVLRSHGYVNLFPI